MRKVLRNCFERIRNQIESNTCGSGLAYEIVVFVQRHEEAYILSAYEPNRGDGQAAESDPNLKTQKLSFFEFSNLS